MNRQMKATGWLMPDWLYGISDVVGKIVGWFFVAVLACVAYFWVFPQEEEALLKYEDCRKTITTETRPAWDVFRKYSCQYFRDGTPLKIVGGTCVHVETATFSGRCEVARVYPVTEADSWRRSNK